MKTEFIIEKILDLIYEKKEGGTGIGRNGMYGMPRNIFLEGITHFLNTGQNVLIEYDKLIWMSWEEDSLSEEEINLLEKALKGETYWNIHTILPQEKIESLRQIYNNSKQEIQYRKTYEYRRIQASIFTSNPQTRKTIFARDGKRCKNCSTTTKLTLDHIVSVKNGGKNIFENLQVLCRSCNSSKSDK